ncbi:MAG: ATP-dependent DNA helicase RecG [Candidatus Yanofskybacteria bacterium]|nr:ATP-dependent DNA helicase RecG [Candidatus Yanofskybacteria bacterium]
MDPSLSIEKLRNVGPRNISKLSRLGIRTVKDLLRHFPIRYEDYTEIIPIDRAEPGQKVNIQGEVLKISSRHIFPRRMSVTNAIVSDSSGAIKVVWFNQPYIENQLTEGTLVSLAGKVSLNKNGLYLSSPAYERIGSNIDSQTIGLKHTSGLVPVYPETEGVTSKYLRFLIKPLIKDIALTDPLPESILSKYNFPDISKALSEIHFPKNLQSAETAKDRFAFEDLLLFQIKALLERRKMNQLKSISIPFNQELIQGFIAQLPFSLTTDQKIAAWEILKDIQKSYPMNRLLEGDVGSGKTVVALIAAYQIAKRGHQTALMIPTEVLARQHYKTIALLFKDASVHTALLTGSESKLDGQPVTKKILKEGIASGQIQIIIGTHAVIQKDVSFDKLALVVIDEQHRFGIHQRKALLSNSELRITNSGPGSNTKSEIRNPLIPHLLSMTATPIPRTLALTIYGDLDISLIKEKPKDRQKIITKIVGPKERRDAYQFVRNEVKKGRQVFVVCPRIEISDPKKEIKVDNKRSKMNILWQEVKAVEEEYRKLSEEVFPDLKVAMLHGKLKPKEKNGVMDKFKNGEYDIVVSTSVIEVGVDIPNASIMMIESAERFGLAQLHQFRGRVGRGAHQSYCLLLSSSAEKSVNQRLKALVECDDGFDLAEKDMKIRGPGEFFGVKQSGLPDLAMASLANVELIKKARLEARLLLKEDSSLKNYPLLRERLESFQKLTHFE